MKKVLLLIIISIVSVLHAYAQDDTPQMQSADSIALKLAQLQKDYNYMSCDFQLFRMKSELNGLSQDANIKAIEVLLNTYNSRYSRDLYSAYLKNYDAYCALFDSKKEEYKHLNTWIMLQIATSDFTDTQLRVISATFDSIDKTIASVEASLDFYDSALQTYKNKRW